MLNTTEARRTRRKQIKLSGLRVSVVEISHGLLCKMLLTLTVEIQKRTLTMFKALSRIAVQGNCSKRSGYLILSISLPIFW